MDGGIGPGLAVLIPHSWREWAVTSIGGDVYVHGWDVWKKGAIPVATASAVRPQITPPPRPQRAPARVHKCDRCRDPAGMAGIDRSGLIGGNVAGWVKGLRLGSDPRLLAVRGCVSSIWSRTPTGMLDQQTRDGFILKSQ